MFDASVVCVVRLSSSPLASCEALRGLKELISLREGTGEVIQAQHQSLSQIGGSDAKPSEVTPCKPIAAVPSVDGTALLGESTRRDSTAGPGAARGAITRRCAKGEGGAQ